jgi:hypothetical protein
VRQHSLGVRCTRFAGVVVLLTLVVAPPASAANKPYSLVISPGIATGGTTVTMTATFTNETAHQRLGAANLMPPAQLQVTSASVPPPGEATLTSSCTVGALAGPCVQLRNLALAPGRAVTVTMSVKVPAAAASCQAPTAYTWSVEAKQANNFNGAGNDLNLDSSSSSLTTAVSCAVGLKFMTQPNNAAVGQTITGSAFDPTGPPVTVETVNASGSPVNSSAPVTIALGTNPSAATLAGTTTKNPAVNGPATFSNLTLNKPGNGYTLVASSPGLTGATSSAFDETSAGTACPQGQSCSISLSTSTSTLDVTAFPSTNGSNDAGTLTGTVNTGQPLVCSGYTPRDQNWYGVLESTSNRAKTITYTLKNTSPSGVELCFGAPYEFETLDNQNAPAGTLPDGSAGFVGLLEHCESFGEPPEACVQSIVGVPDAGVSSGQDTVATIRIDAGLPGDPHMRG